MFRYRMSAKPVKWGWVLVLLIIGLLLISLASQLGRPKPAETAPEDTQSASAGFGVRTQELWLNVRQGVAFLFANLAGNHADRVDINLGAAHEGAGDDEEELPPGDITVEVENPLAPDSFIPEGLQAQVLIYHTHSHEAYTKVGGQDYAEVAKWRTVDNNYNIAKVGEALAMELYLKYGIPVLHDKTDNEYPKLGTSYSRSLKTMQKNMAAHGDLKLLLDLHRDAFSAGINPASVTINGKKVARIMVVIGTGEGQTGVGFSERPDWKKNLALAEAITGRLNEFDPQLARKVNLKTGRYNQHVSTGAILIEVGHNKNTLEEALNAMPYLAQAIADAYNVLCDSGAVTPNPPAALPTGTVVPLPSPSPSGGAQVITIEPISTVRPGPTEDIG